MLGYNLINCTCIEALIGLFMDCILGCTLASVVRDCMMITSSFRLSRVKRGPPQYTGYMDRCATQFQDTWDPSTTREPLRGRYDLPFSRLFSAKRHRTARMKVNVLLPKMGG